MVRSPFDLAISLAVYLIYEPRDTDIGFDDQGPGDGFEGLAAFEPWGLLPNDSVSNVNPGSPAGAYRNPLEGHGGDRRSMAMAARGQFTQNNQPLHHIKQQQLQHHQQFQQKPNKQRQQQHQQQPQQPQPAERGRSNTISKGKKGNDGWTNASNPVWGPGAGSAVDNGWGIAGEDNWAEGGGGGGGWAADEDTRWDAQAADGWGQATKGGQWGAAPNDVQYNGGGMGNWPAGSRIPKVTVTSPSAAEARTVLSSQQHSHLLSSLLNRTIISRQGHGFPDAQTPASLMERERQREGGKKKNKKKHHSPPRNWAAEEPIEEEPEGEMEDFDFGHQSEHKDNWFSDVGTHWETPSYSMPSKTFAIASDGRVPLSGRPRHDNAEMDSRFVESQGKALIPAVRALYSRERLARDRIHWSFDPYKDQRVFSLLEWIQNVAYDLASVGVGRFVLVFSGTSTDYHISCTNSFSRVKEALWW